ncbi:MAG: LytTR family DNA-binding domain-containing protein [Bacteroidales bacterium]|nr:LytTR family DNA-binding domain-containing protein [Bacteroidales bacterium]
MLRTIIVDDESPSRETIEQMLNLYCNNVEVVAHADGVRSGIKAIKKHEPDLVLLDIKMPDGTGFDILRQMDPINFKVIFITAYEEYAVKAFKFSALDYLLKPIDPEELKEAVEKSNKLIEKDNIDLKLNAFLNNYYSESDNNTKKIVLKTTDSIFLFELEDIVHVEADGNYTRFSVEGEKEDILVSKPLRDFSNLLESNDFLKIHQSHIINTRYVRRFDRDQFICYMKDGSKIPVSHRNKDKLMKMFKGLSK